MLRLTANKSKFYALAKDYWPEIPPRKQVEFIKYPRRRDYGLVFQAGGYYHRLFLATCAGKVCLSHEWSDGDKRSREVHNPSLDKLRQYGLVEEVPTKEQLSSVPPAGDQEQT